MKRALIAIAVLWVFILDGRSGGVHAPNRARDPTENATVDLREGGIPGNLSRHPPQSCLPIENR